MQWHYVSLRVKIGHLKMPRHWPHCSEWARIRKEHASIVFGGGVAVDVDVDADCGLATGGQPPLNAIAAAN